MNEEETKLFLRTLSGDKNLEILRWVLYQNEKGINPNCTALAKAMGTNPINVSFKISGLVKAGLLKQIPNFTKSGKERLLVINNANLEMKVDFLKYVRGC